MTTHTIIKINPPRELSKVEQDVLSRLLSAEFQGSQTLRIQASKVKVTEECKDCLTIGLEVPQDNSLRADVRWTIPVEAEGLDLDSVNIHFLLHVVDGFLDELEIFREDLSKVVQLPQPDQLVITTLD